MIYGYARVSTKGQARDGNSLAYQKNALIEAGATRIYLESFTGTKRHRPELDDMLEALEEGDTVVCTKLDRIARSAKDGLEIVDLIIAKGCKINILNMGVFDSSPTGKLMRTIMFGFAEFERDLIVQRITEGKEVARMKPGYKEGRPRKMDVAKFLELVRMERKGEITRIDACKNLGIAESTWFNYLAKYNIPRK